jgi:LysM repeat protein
VSDRIGYGEQELRDANPQIKDFNKLQVGQEIHFPSTTTTVKSGETQMGQVAKRLGVTENALRSANPGAKEPLQVGQELNHPEYYDTQRNPRENKPSGPRTPSKPAVKVEVSDKGVSVKTKVGNVNVSPGGDVTVTPPKIGPVETEIKGEGVTPKLPSGNADRIKNPKEATRKQDDWKNLDAKTKEKLDKEQLDPGRKITDREIRKINQPPIDKEFEARQAYERIHNPLPKKSLRMRDQ